MDVTPLSPSGEPQTQPCTRCGDTDGCLDHNDLCQNCAWRKECEDGENDTGDDDEPVLVFSYSRAQALEDGVLVDVSQVAAEAGLAYPTAITAAAWADCVAWSPEDSARQTTQDEAGRLWDVLWMARMGMRRASGRSECLFKLYRVPRGGRGHMPRLTTLKVVCGPGDTLDPVLTLMLPEED